VFGAAWAAAIAPTVTVGDASQVSYTSAHAEGTVDAQGQETFCHFEYISQARFDENLANGFGEWESAEQSPCNLEPVTGSGPQAVEADLQGLTPATVYHLRLVASNADGQSEAVAANTFEADTVPPASVTIDPVADPTGTTAAFSGTVNPQAPAGNPPAFDVSWTFECTPACPGLSGGSIPADSSTHVVSDEASALDPNTAYEVRLVASNAGGRAESTSEAFTTDPVAPVVETLGAGSIEVDAANLAAAVNPRGSAVTYQFEWGEGANLDQRAPADPADLGAADQSPHFVNATIAGLAEATRYSFRISATNTENGETSTGQVRTFTTASAEPAAAGCGNEAVRTEQGARWLPDCRAYEMVSPPDKNGGSLASGFFATDDGSRIASGSASSFGSGHSSLLFSPYVSERAASGWTTFNLAPRAGVGLALDGGFLKSGTFAGDLAASLSITQSYPAEPRVRNIFATTLAGDTTWVTAPTRPGAPIADKLLTGASADLSHVVFESRQEFSERNTNGENEIWEWVDGSMRLVSVMSDGSLAGQPVTGGRGGAGEGLNASDSFSTSVISHLPQPTAVSADGSRIFFTASGGVGSDQIFVREDGVRTDELSLSQRPGEVGQEPAGGAAFVAAAVDGSKVVFSSPDRLTADATEGGGLYRYDLDSDELRFLTPSPSAGGPEIEGVSFVADDASRVYFVARAQLVPGEGQPGGHNLYETGPDGPRFIATLADADVQDWALGFGNGSATALTAKGSPDGRFFVFQSTVQLTGYASAGHVEIYEWDEGAASVRCVSCGATGTSAGGDASLIAHPVDPSTGSTIDGSLQLGTPRGLSADGSRVFFQTTDSLAPRDVNGTWDVYVSEAGQPRLISSGTSGRPSEILDNSASGDDAFFATTESLVATDTDHEAGDVYDARVGGGFALGGMPAACGGGDCQPSSAPPPFFGPASAGVHGGPKVRSNRLAKALRTCRKKHRKKKERQRCVSRAKAKFGHKHVKPAGRR
jgi:WD40-like Beta Propeller Repeat